MAIIMFGAMVVGARGTAGGLIFSANKAGPYVRSWSKGSNPATPAQAAQRAIIGDFAKAWADLTQAERDDWIDYADDPAQELTNSLGETFFASGFNWYIRINTHLNLAGAAARDDAPTLTRPVAPDVTAIALETTASGLDTRIQYAAGDPGLAENHTVFGRLFSSTGRNANNSNWRLLKIAIPDGARQIRFQPEMEAAYGTITTNMTLFIRTNVQDAHGQRGPDDTISDKN